ncbi:hypothetical protein RI129_009203 [Pyrocoelia pectoralis]|uniref:Alpha 1,4-glycosyltransferase domain-containing protein n=1 Tax=Pyrocoelia pectoralis TaxID=417401 RepID=A0AAN7VDD4_9COLE
MLKNCFVFLIVVVVVTVYYYVYWWEPEQDTSLGCYTAGGDTLPDILDIKTPSEKSTYFIDTSCTSYTKGKIFITPRQACAVESAAFNNPDFQTFLMYASPGSIKDDNTLSDRLLKILTNIVNVKVVRLNYAGLLNGNVYTKERIQLLILYKYGGIYLDLDTVTIRSFNGLALNFAVAESETHVNNAVIRSSIKGSGHEFIKMCLKELKEYFRGDFWGYNGPVVVTKILKKMCEVNNIKDIMYKKKCSGFTVYPPEKFYPIFYENWRLYFEDARKKEKAYVMGNSYAIHVWNKLSKNTVSNSSGSIYRYAAGKYCPQVYSIAREYF